MDWALAACAGVSFAEPAPFGFAAPLALGPVVLIAVAAVALVAVDVISAARRGGCGRRGRRGGCGRRGGYGGAGRGRAVRRVVVGPGAGHVPRPHRRVHRHAHPRLAHAGYLPHWPLTDASRSGTTRPCCPDSGRDDGISVHNHPVSEVGVTDSQG